MSPEALRVLAEAKAIAEEWVTPMRLQHVLSNSGLPMEIQSTGKIIALMIDDIIREAEGEITDTPSARKEISRHTALMYKKLLNSMIEAR